MDREILRNRFKDAPWFPVEPIYAVVGGAGGIGSWLTLLLARAGIDVIVFDYDSIESHNIGGQLYGIDHIGRPKVLALEEIVFNFSEVNISALEEKFTVDSMGHQFMFAAFDNMEARKSMFENWMNNYVTPYRETGKGDMPLLIDGRLLMEQLQIFCITPYTAEAYQRDHLFDDDEVITESCTMKQTSHSASMIASFMVGFFTNHLTNLRQGSAVRQVPYYYEYFIPINLTS